MLRLRLLVHHYLYRELMSLNDISSNLLRESVRQIREICAKSTSDLEYKHYPSLNVLLPLQNLLEGMGNLDAKLYARIDSIVQIS